MGCLRTPVAVTIGTAAAHPFVCCNAARERRTRRAVSPGPGELPPPRNLEALRRSLIHPDGWAPRLFARGALSTMHYPNTSSSDLDFAFKPTDNLRDAQRWSPWSAVEKGAHGPEP